MTILADFYRLGNVIVVDDVNGEDSDGQKGQFPFKTVGAAVTAAASGDCIYILPGAYLIPSSGLTIPTGVTIRGLNTGAVELQLLNATASTTMITMGSSTRLEDVTLTLTSSQHVDLTAVRFPNGTSALAKLRSLVVNVNNSTAGSGSSNIYGIVSDGNAFPGDEVNAIRSSMVSIYSTGDGVKRALLSNAANFFSARDSNFVCRKVGSGAGSYIACETNHTGCKLVLRECLAEGSSADISQTLGILLFGGQLINGNSNNTPVETTTALPFIIFGDSGNAPSNATRFLRPGTAPVSANEIKVRLPQSGIARTITVRAKSPPGSGKTDTWTLRKNGVDTIMVVTLSGSETFSSNSNSVSFSAGDDLSLKIVTATATATSDMLVIIDFLK